VRRAYAITILAALALVMAAGAPAYADPGGNGNGQGNPPDHAGGNGNNGNGNGGGNGGGNDGSPNGANGTVKIHDWPEHKNSSEMANDPKVCQFEIHGFNFDAGESEGWWIQAHKWGNGDRSKAVLSGSYTANGDGDWTSGPHSLADGHYKLFVEMEHGTLKHKVFKVDCPPPNAGEEGDEEGNDEEGDQEGDEEGNEQGDQESDVAGQQSTRTETACVANMKVTRTFVNENLVSVSSTGETCAAVGVQLGVEQGPTGRVSPIVEQPAGEAAQAGAQVAGQQAAPVMELPSTSTEAGSSIAALLTGIGVWLMRRRSGDR